MWKKYKDYIIFSLISLAVGALAAFFTRNGFKMFDNISKPPLSPPAFIFPIAWTILYILMGIGAAIVYKKTKNIPFIYPLQLLVNFLWPIIFFNMQAYMFAFIWLIMLFLLVIIMTYEFYRISKTAAYLQIPYLVWLVFAGYLNFGIWLLN